MLDWRTVQSIEYAIHAMLGIDAPRRNRRLVARVQSLWAQAREAMARGGGEGLFVRHVRAHQDHLPPMRRPWGWEWNREADRLAARGAAGVVWGVGASQAPTG